MYIVYIYNSIHEIMKIMYSQGHLLNGLSSLCLVLQFESQTANIFSNFSQSHSLLFRP